MAAARRTAFVLMVLAGIENAAIFLSPLIGELSFWGRIAAEMAGSESAAIGIIGGADGPTAIFTTSRVAPHVSVCLLAFVALYAAWSVLCVKTGK